MTASLKLFRRVALAGTALTLLVVVLGAWVRLSDAGLGCPDWPGCYGHITAGSASQNIDAISEAFPHRPFEYHKAIKEMVHRYFATGVGLVSLLLAGLAIYNRRDPQQPVFLPIFLVGLVIFQGMLGMWTVTLLLKPLIVVLHLLGGLSTLAVMSWLAMRRPATPPTSAGTRQLRSMAGIALAVLAFQIFLGGWTSSNYAAYSCPDFPTCQASWWPDMDMDNAFVLWRGLGIDYEGGVLNHPARVAIHFVHRLGAIAAALVVGALAWAAWRRGENRNIRIAGAVLGTVLVAQLILGPVMVLKTLPLSLATAHNGVAALLVLAMMRLMRQLR